LFDAATPQKVQHHAPNSALLLVGLKADMPLPHVVSREQGVELAAKIGAYKYVECSSLDGTGTAGGLCRFSCARPLLLNTER
jgi:hypothetical protein